MKKIITMLFTTTALASSALAADLPSKKAPAVVPAPVFSWTGPYLGVNIGGGWMNGGNGQVWSLDPVTGTNTMWSKSGSGNAGVIGGVQVGYNYQVTPMFVVGGETDFQGSTLGGGYNGAYNAVVADALNGNSVAGYTGATKLNWFGTVRGRLGVVPLSPALLVYGTGGFAYGDVSRTGTYGGTNAMQVGWTAGGGVEYAFTPAWSIKAEYLYSSLSGQNQQSWFNTPLSLNNVNNSTSWNTIRAGVNYHFNTHEILGTHF